MVASPRSYEPLTNARPGHPCPICGKEDWCGFNSVLAVCMRVPSERFCRGKNGKPDPGKGYIHFLGDRPKEQQWAAPALSVRFAANVVDAAPVEIRDAWYRRLLSVLGLSADHKEALLARGLSEETIAKRMYATLPVKGRLEIVRRVMQTRAGTPEGVPGFYLHPEKDLWLIAGATGLLIPIVNKDGLIQGLQVRQDNSTNPKRRYAWVSSRMRALRGNARAGSCSGAPVHVSYQGTFPLERAYTVWITEGPLKADRLAEERKEPVLAVPGVTIREEVVQLVCTLGAKEAIVAYDMDRFENAAVSQNFRLLCNELKVQGVRVGVATWNPAYKGIDDAIEAGQRIKVRPWLG